jgi:hypothetical protein
MSRPVAQTWLASGAEVRSRLRLTGARGRTFEISQHVEPDQWAALSLRHRKER